MEEVFSVTALCMVGAVLVVTVRRSAPEFALLLSFLCILTVAAAAFGLLRPILRYFDELRALAGIEPSVLQPLLKTVAIGILTQISCSFCQDAGEQALGKLSELVGCIAAVYVSLPLVSAVMELIQTMVGG